MSVVNTFLEVLETVLTERLSDSGVSYTIAMRPLRPNDPNRSIGIFAVDWQPRQETMEMGGPGSPEEPLLQRYNIRVQNLVKHSNEAEGRAMFADDAKTIRAILYRDMDLRVRLLAIQETDLGSLERVKKYGVRQQRYLNNDVRGTMLYLTATELWFETENVPTA